MNTSRPSLQTKKILFQYLLVTVISICAGIAFSALLQKDLLLSSAYQMSLHFEYVFSACNGIADGILEVMAYSLTDLLLALLSFAFSFSVLHCLITDLILGVLAFRIGFSVYTLWYVFGLEQMTYTPKAFHIWIFTVVKLLLLVAFFLYSYYLSGRSYQFRSNSELEPRKNACLVGPSTLVTLLSFWGILLILNGLYCLLIFFI